MKNKLKITGIISVIVFLVFSITCISWYTYLKMFGKDRIVSTTFEIGLQTTTDGDTRYFMEVNSYDNCYEIKFNYILDENREHFFSQGLQYYSEKDSISMKKTYVNYTTYHSENFFGWETEKWDSKTFYTHFPSGSERINYMSSNDYVDTMISSNPIDNNTHFKITLDRNGKDVVYLMKFKGDILREGDVKYKDWGLGYTRFTDYYDVYDVDMLAGLVFQGIGSLSYGTAHACVFEFGDLFTYFEPVESKEGAYQEVKQEDSELIYEDLKSYFSIKVTRNEGKIQKASQSLFNCVNGSPDFNITSSDSQDYFYGRTIINVDNVKSESELSYVKITDTKVALKLSDNFNNAYMDYSDKIEVFVLVDLDLLKAEGLEFVGFTKDCGLQNYNVVSCQTVETVNGELVYSGVTYE